MRGFVRRRSAAEEEESVFVTMTDMTISFLLIVMILLAFFATQLSSDDTVPRDQFDAVLSSLREARAEVRRLQIERDAAISERDAAISERDKALAEVAQLKARNDDLLIRLQELEAQLARVLAELDQLASTVEELRADNDSLRAELERTKASLEEITTERDELLRKIKALQAEIAEQDKEIDQLKAELAEVTAERDDLRARLARIEQVNPLEAYLAEAIEQRREILADLRERLLIEFPDLEVVISPEQDALRFQGEGLFRSGSSRLGPRQREIVETMGRLLDDILVCFTLGERATRGPDCDSGNALIEAVQIEGHTDSDGADLDNLRLSTNRANETFYVLLGQDQAILAHRNIRDQPVMSVSGYGEMRPIQPNETPDQKAANRRIDLRIIMYAPSTVEEVERIGRRLQALREAGGDE